MISIKLNGFLEAQKKTSQDLTPALARAVFKSANHQETESKKNLKNVIYSRKVPWQRTGKLQQSVAVQKLNDLVSKVYVGVNYGIFVEEGTRPRTIQAKGGKYLSWVSGGQRHFSKKINHPGTKPYPFWKPAIKSTQAEAPNILQKEIDKLIK